jgi:hypothetical protein
MGKELDEKPYLKLTRFCGEELYPIETATWFYSKNEDDNINELCLDIRTDYGHQLSEDTKTLGGQPHWELTIRLQNLKVSDLNVGFKTEISNGYDEDIEDHLTNFYYCEHEQTDNNSIEIVEKQGNRASFTEIKNRYFKSLTFNCLQAKVSTTF